MLPTPPLTAKNIALLQNRALHLWHERENEIDNWPDAIRALGGHSDGGTDNLVYDLGVVNTFQWHEEDKARKFGVTDQFLGEVKRSIDASNQRRTDNIEELDARLVQWLNEAGVNPDDECPMNSETPGSIIDRLSILRLKIYHMHQESTRDEASKTHIEKCRAKLDVLYEQERDLNSCFDALLHDLLRGRKRLTVYFQFKMYNDPDTNPEIYRNR